MPSPRIIATSASNALAAALAATLMAACLAGPALAQQARTGAGYVANLSGPLFALKADGTRRVLSTRSEIHSGDTLITEDRTYARVRFSDTSEVTLRPSTQLKIENYSFDRAEPENDNSLFRLFKGALRTVTGLIGRRGNRDAYRMNTATATIGIRGTVYGVTVCVPGSCGDQPPGTYVNVIDGSVGIAPAVPTVPGAPPVPPPAQVVLAAGQFGYVPPTGPATQLPGDPGVGTFAPPASFVQRPDAPPPTAQLVPGTPASKPVGGPASGECEVR